MKTNEMQLLRRALRRLRVDAIRAAWRVAIAGSRGETSQAALNCNAESLARCCHQEIQCPAERAGHYVASKSQTNKTRL